MRHGRHSPNGDRHMRYPSHGAATLFHCLRAPSKEEIKPGCEMRVGILESGGRVGPTYGGSHCAWTNRRKRTVCRSSGTAGGGRRCPWRARRSENHKRCQRLTTGARIAGERRCNTLERGVYMCASGVCTCSRAFSGPVPG